MTRLPAERTLLLRHARTVVTMDDERREIADGAVFIRGRVIEQVGRTGEVTGSADEVIDLRSHVLIPGLVNTHHHMFQALTRAVPSAQDSTLFAWLRELYPIWTRLTPEHVYVSALTAMAELVLSGCTTTSDHLYLFPKGTRVDETVQAAEEIGVRFHVTRGAMSVGESLGGLPPDDVVEREDEILGDMRRVIEAFHDPSRYAMRRVGLAPCSPFSVSRDLMREARSLARAYGVRLHTHFAEDASDVAWMRERYGLSPAEYLDELGWLGPDVWLAHAVHVDGPAIERLAGTETSVAHCPSSNLRLAAGIAPVRLLQDAGVAVSLGVDGSASNDSGHLLLEARLAMLLQRSTGDAGAMTARGALEVATIGGARALGRDDIGILAPGRAADLVAYDVDQLPFAGAAADPVAALILCAPVNVDMSIVNGRVLVKGGRLLTVDVDGLVERHRRAAEALLA